MKNWNASFAMPSSNEETISHLANKHTNPIGGRAPKRHQNTFAKWSEQSLQHTMDKSIINLNAVQQTPETIVDILKNSIVDLKPTIKEELRRKRALKFVIALHAAFHQATNPTFLTEPHPVFKSLPLEILLATDIDQVLHTIIEQIPKREDEYEERGI